MSVPSPAVRAAGSIHVLRTPSFPSPPYPETAPEPITDEAIAELIQPILTRHSVHKELPPMWLLVRVYRNAGRHFLGPRRKRFGPHTRPRQWALHDVNKCVIAWFSGRPDNTGAWRQHMELADWTKRIIHVKEGEPTPEPPNAEREAARKAYEARRALAEAEKAALATGTTRGVEGDLPPAAESRGGAKWLSGPPADPPPKKIDMRTREGKAIKAAKEAV